MARLKVYRYLDSDSLKTYNQRRHNPDKPDLPAEGKSIDVLVDSIITELARSWAAPARRRGPGASPHVVDGVRRRNVRYYLRAAVYGYRASELAELEGLSVRQMQRSVKSGRELVVESRERLSSLLALGANRDPERQTQLDA